MKLFLEKVDRIGLLIVSVIVVFLSVLFIGMSSSFNEKFSYSELGEGEKGRDMMLTSIAKLEDSTRELENADSWKLPKRGFYQGIPVFNSIPVVWKDGEIYVLADPSSKPLRPPMSNKFLIDHRLRFDRSDVGQLDPDGDGFNNLEEFNSGTSPVDANDHPPLTNKLFVMDRVEIPYGLKLRSSAGEFFSVEQLPSGQVSRPVTKGDKIFDDRFEVIESEGEVRRLRDRSSGKVIDLKKGETANLPSYRGVFSYEWKGSREMQIGIGEVFQISGSNSFFTLLEIDLGGAVIAPCDSRGEVLGEKIEIFPKDKITESETSLPLFL